MPVRIFVLPVFILFCLVSRSAVAHPGLMPHANHSMLSMYIMIAVISAAGIGCLLMLFSKFIQAAK